MNLIRHLLIQTVAIAVFWLVALPVAGQEEIVPKPAATSSESTSTPQEISVAPTPTSDQMLTGEFELLQENIIESVSKRSESIFDSPLSADVITRDQIQKAGARTIPEALRLLPGVIVREQTSGNFDVHVRGLDGVIPGGALYDFFSTTVLVMIDYRVVYNYFQGGTYWEALPIDIVDIERIELVRGPVAALYGPNAVTGAINIITRKLTTNGLHVSAQAEAAGQQGWKDNFSLGQRKFSGRVGYKYNAISGGLSANYLSFDRLEGGLYSYYFQKRVARPEDLVTLVSNTPESIGDQARVAYPEPNLGRRSVGVNAFTTYEPNEKLSFTLTGGYQESRTLREYINSVYSPTNTHDGQNWYIDLRSHFYNFNFQASFWNGHQAIPGQNQGAIRNGSECIFNTLDLNLEYDFVWEWLRVRPGVSFRRSQFTGAVFSTFERSTSDDTWLTVSETKEIQNAAVSVGLEQTPWKKLRFVEAVRLDVYFDRTEHNYYPSTPLTSYTEAETRHGQTLYPSFEFAMTYTPVEDHILRVSYGRASKSPSMMGSYYSYITNYRAIGGNFDADLMIKGNNAYDLLTLDSVELGYRTHVSSQIDMAIEVFGNYARNYGTMSLHGVSAINGIILQYDNIPLKAWQLGATVSAGFTLRRLQGQVFATIQQTRLTDVDPNMYRTNAFTNKENLIDKWHQGTPEVFGGFYLNYQPIDPLNINVNAYYFSRHTQIPSDTTGIDIQQSFLLNAKVSYNLWAGLAAYINVRNLFNINQAQFAWGDANHILCLIGLQYEL